MGDGAVVVTSDGSDTATRAVAEAARLAALAGDALHIVAPSASAGRVADDAPAIGPSLTVHGTDMELNLAGWELAQDLGADLLVLTRGRGNPLRRLVK